MIFAGGGFHEMAWRLALSRVPHASSTQRYYASREAVERTPPDCYPVHREYYRIIDKAEASFPLVWIPGVSNRFPAHPVTL